MEGEKEKSILDLYSPYYYLFFYGFAMNNSGVLWHTLIAPHYFLLLQAEIR